MNNFKIGDNIVFNVINSFGLKQSINGIVQNFRCSKKDGMFYIVQVNENTQTLIINEKDLEEMSPEERQRNFYIWKLSCRD